MDIMHPDGSTPINEMIIFPSYVSLSSQVSAVAVHCAVCWHLAMGNSSFIARGARFYTTRVTAREFQNGVPGSRSSDRLNKLTPELNPSAQRWLTRIFTGGFASWTVHFDFCVKNQQMQQLFIHLINYVVAPTCFGIILPSAGSVPSAFWEMQNWGAVDRILWMGVLCLVTRCVAIWVRRVRANIVVVNE
jgi:hypothetical protein